MKSLEFFNVLLAPVFTEKTTRLADKNRQVAFKVAPTASKTHVKNAVEKLFNVKVDAVRVVNQKGKNKRFGQMMGKRKDVRKAYVSLAEGHDINFSDFSA